MITLLEGTLLEKNPTRIVVLVAGVGYEVFIPLSTYDRLPRPGSPCRILTYEYVREDTHALYGFLTGEERSLFVRLLGVSGVGPRLALAALSGLSPRQLVAAVGSGDVRRLSSVSGIGRKTAERIVVELKDKLSEAEIAAAGGAARRVEDPRIQDAVVALTALGYRRTEAQKMVSGAAGELPEGATVEELVRRALVRGR